MKAISWPSGDQRGTAIWRPWSGPGVVAGSRIQDVCGGERSGQNGVGRSALRDDGDELDGAELGDPPVIFAGGFGADEGDGEWESGDQVNSKT